MRLLSPPWFFKLKWRRKIISSRLSAKPRSLIFWCRLEFYAKQGGLQSAVLQMITNSSQLVVLSELYGNGIEKKQIILSGRTIDSETGKPLQCNVVVGNLNSGRILQETISTRNGYFTTVLKTGFNYGVAGVSKKYFSSGVNVDLTASQQSDTVSCTIFLSDVKQNAKVTLNNIFFETGKADILSCSEYELLRLVTFLKTNRVLAVEIHGHTDNIGSESTNMILSKKRAESVKHYLTSKGISSDRIKIKYFGESCPVADNTTAKGRKSNRRVEIVFK